MRLWSGRENDGIDPADEYVNRSHEADLDFAYRRLPVEARNPTRVKVPATTIMMMTTTTMIAMAMAMAMTTAMEMVEGEMECSKVGKADCIWKHQDMICAGWPHHR